MLKAVGASTAFLYRIVVAQSLIVGVAGAALGDRGLRARGVADQAARARVRHRAPAGPTPPASSRQPGRLVWRRLRARPTGSTASTRRSCSGHDRPAVSPAGRGPDEGLRQPGAREVRAVDGVSFATGAGEITLVMGPSGSGQDDPADDDRRRCSARPSGRVLIDGSRSPLCPRRELPRVRRESRRLRLPDVQPARVADGARERRGRAQRGRRQGPEGEERAPRTCSSRPASRRGSTSRRATSPAARSSASRSRARSRTGRRCSSPTSPPRTSTRATATRSWSSFATSQGRRRAAVVVSHDPRLQRHRRPRALARGRPAPGRPSARGGGFHVKVP